MSFQQHPVKIIFLTAMAILSIPTFTSAQSPEILTIRAGHQKSAAGGEITVRFVAVEEDSRCPANANCVWSGNARIKVKVTNRGGTSKMMLMNTDMGPKGDQYDGWAIYLTSLTPLPRSNAKTTAARYTAMFSVARLSR